MKGFKAMLRIPDWVLALCLVVLAVPVWRWWQSAQEPRLPEVCLAVGDHLPTPTSGMIRIAGGRFKMGSDEFRAEEAPVRDVSVGAFWIDAHDVTNAQFARFVRETGYITVAERATQGQPAGSPVFVTPLEIRDMQDLGQWWKFIPGANWLHPEGPVSDITRRQSHPVVHVAYEDASAFARWAGRTLPTEVQWEFAARSGLDGKRFSWGNEHEPDDEPQGNYWRGIFPVLNFGSKGFKGTSPVGCFPANGYGLYDMTGNVWQWTRDAWTPDHDPTSSLTQPASYVETQVIKGGSFLCATNFCLRYRPAARQPGDSGGGASHIGFRTVFEPSDND